MLWAPGGGPVSPWLALPRPGFALAGSGAIREHGVIDRPTEDVDLFTTTQDTAEFARAVERVVADLRGSGYEVEEARRAALFAPERTAAAVRMRDQGESIAHNATVLVGVTGFEPAASSSRTKRATKLRHTPEQRSTA